MRILRKKTEILRATLTTELREILSVELGVSIGAVRCVQVLTPPGPACCFGVDREPKDIGPGRSYWLPSFPVNQVVKFYLQADQSLYGMVKGGDGGNAEASLIVEFYDEDVQGG
jgi:hypothetical protein